MKKRLLLLLLPVLACLLVACGGKKNENAYVIYYLNTQGTALEKVDYEAEATDTLELIDEFIQVLSTDVNSVDYMKPIPQDVSVDDYQLTDGSLSVYFNRDYYSMEGYSEVLVRAAVVKTLMQVDGVDDVTFYVSNSPLVDTAKNVVGAMNQDTFIEDFGEETESLLNTTLTLYFASADGQSLVKEQKKVYYSSNVPIEKLVMEYLLKGPDIESAKASIPENTKLLGITVTDGTCYVNLNSTFLNQMSDISEQVVIYSIVDSLTEVDAINKVQISVNGDTTGILYNSYQLSTIYERNDDIIIETITKDKEGTEENLQAE